MNECKVQNEIKYTVLGDARTKKNSQMIAGAGKRCPVCKKPEKQWIRQGKPHDEFKRRAMEQLRPIPATPIESEVNVKCLFYMATRRKVDSLNLLAAIDDLLVDTQIIADDNSRIVVAHDGSRVLYDPQNPRVEITITMLESNQLSVF